MSHFARYVCVCVGGGGVIHTIDPIKIYEQRHVWIYTQNMSTIYSVISSFVQHNDIILIHK